MGAMPTQMGREDWPRLLRLVLLSLFGSLASIGNIFTVSAVIIDDLLRKKGNAFLVSLALADLLVTAFVLPASSVAILAEREDSADVCKFQYGVGSLSAVTAAVFSAAVGLENLLRARVLSGHQPLLCSPTHVAILNVWLWILSAALALVHALCWPSLSTALCGQGNSDEGAAVLGAIAILLLTLAGAGQAVAFGLLRRIPPPRSFLTSRQLALCGSNSAVWAVRFGIWAIWAIGAALRGQDFHKGLEWVGLLPACLSSVVQAVGNRDLRRVYGELFHYCCCKTSVAVGRRTRDPLRSSDVRVHILPGYNIYSAAHGEVPRPSNTYLNKRDVYEL